MHINNNRKRIICTITCFLLMLICIGCISNDIKNDSIPAKVGQKSLDEAVLNIYFTGPKSMG